MDLDAFFMEEGIDEYTIVRIEDLQDADRSGLLHLIPWFYTCWLRISVGTAGGVCGHARAGQSVPMGSMSSGAGISAHGSLPRCFRQRPGCWSTSPSSALQLPSPRWLPVMQPCDAAFV